MPNFPRTQTTLQPVIYLADAVVMSGDSAINLKHHSIKSQFINIKITISGNAS